MSERKTPAGEAVDPGLLQKKRARRRLIGAVTLSLSAALILSFALDQEPRPLRDDLILKMPAREAGDGRPTAGSVEREAALTPPPDDGPEGGAAVRPAPNAKNLVVAQTPAGSAAKSAPTSSTPVATAVTAPSAVPSVGSGTAQGAVQGAAQGAVVDSSVSPPQVIVPAGASLPPVFAPFPDAPPPPPVETRSGSRSEPRAEPRSEPRFESRLEPRSEPKAEPKLLAKPERKADTKVDPKSDNKSDAKSDHKTDHKTDPKSDHKLDRKADHKADYKADYKPEVKAGSKPDAKPDARIDLSKTAKPVVKTEPKRDSAAGSGADPDADDPIARIAKSRAAQEAGATRPTAGTASSGAARTVDGAASKPAKTGTYRLQVGAFSSASAAESAVAKLKAAGFSASTETIRGASGTELIRVRTGRYADREAAQRAHDSLRARGVDTTVIAP